MAAEKKKRARKASLEEAALRYLGRFDTTEKKLTEYLRRFEKRRVQSGAEPNANVEAGIRELIQRYRGSGLIDDGRFAALRAQSLRARGTSKRLIAQKLMLQGVPRDTIDATLAKSVSDGDGPPELLAAQAYVKRKRLGRFRSPELQQSERRRDLARLARQGFDFDVAVKALGLGREEDF